ncbi:hypothetical protein [Hyphomicrobium sp. LHD-15]|uniref:hypothetical protein n=1 Tax=Hyphomicrobium sp. LHD-15 TaxID=3072142 RepID=UPI00280E15A6|nr:hypothetical protein [Hyphomicrobium sp. LHD-15]MDQ8698140.1 hypothetical protein [Hyphomicrobium sp. LHD-15]
MTIRTPEQIAQRIMELLEQRHTKPGEYDMFGAIAARLANEEILGIELNDGVEFGVANGWLSLRGPRILRASECVASEGPTTTTTTRR